MAITTDPTTATVDFTGATLSGVIAPDVVSINSTGYTATFATKTVGTGKPVTVIGVILSFLAWPIMNLAVSFAR